MQQTDCGQWFESLLAPFVHFAPARLLFEDLIEKVQWAKECDDATQESVFAANRFETDCPTRDGLDRCIALLLNSYDRFRIDDHTVVKRAGAKSYKEVVGKNRPTSKS